MKWQNVYVFISSTFKDMHAERDYLVKYVFPELTEWCNERKIRLFDIDLRWGVTEEDSMKNKLATEICLKNIDKCRPFFLCFQGQRRGWVPEEADIPESTLKAYPKLKAEIGKRSVTEMEILHGVFSPYQEGHKKVAHPLFFFRDPSYLKDIGNEKLRTRIFGDHNPNNPQLEELQKKKQAEFHKEVKKKFGNCHNYTATFDPSVHSPELENDWLGKDVAEGRLTNFQVGGKPLKDIIISEFKRVITAELKVQAEKIEGLDEQETTLKLQEEYLFSISNDSYIEDEDARKAVLDAVDGTGRKLFLLSAEAGSGKSTFMAKRIAEFSKREDCIVMYRFLGTGAGCDTVSDLLTSIKYQAEKLGLMEEEKKDARTAGEPEAFYFSRLHKKIETPYNRIKDVYEDLKYIFNFILKQAAKKGKKVILFLDGLNQISERLSFDFDFLNVTCPPNVRVVASVKSGSENATKFLESKKNANIYQLNTFGKDEIKLKLIDGHLSQYLKAFDEKQSAILLNKKSSSNPLYLAVVLNEMRQFGAYDDVKLKLNSFGDSPHDAFITMLGSCQTETQYTPIPPADVIPLFFTSLAASRRGLSKTILIKLFKKQFKETYTEIQIEEALNFYLHRFRPYIVQIEGRFTILFETLTIAIKEFYKELIEKIHTYLADILRYETTLSPKNEDDIFAIKEYFYHFHRASYDEALKLLSDYSFLQHKIAHVGIKYLMEDYKLYGKENLPRTAARLFRGFKIDEKILNKDNLTAQLWLRFGGDDDEGIQEIIKLAEKDAPALWLKAKKADSERAWNVVSLSRSLPKPMGTPFKCVAETGTHYVLFQGNDIMDVSTKPAEMILLYKRNLAVADIVHFTHPVTNIEMSGRFIVARGKNYYSIYDPAHMCVAETVCVRKLMRELLPDEKSIQKKGWDVGGMEVIVNDPGGTKPIRIYFASSVGFGERLTVGYTAGKKDYKFHYKEVFEDDDEEDTNKCTSPFALCGKWLFSDEAIIDAQTMKVEGNVHDIIPAKEQNNHLSLLAKPVLFASKIYFGRLIMDAATLGVEKILKFGACEGYHLTNKGLLAVFSRFIKSRFFLFTEAKPLKPKKVSKKIADVSDMRISGNHIILKNSGENMLSSFASGDFVESTNYFVYNIETLKLEGQGSLTAPFAKNAIVDINGKRLINISFDSLELFTLYQNEIEKQDNSIASSVKMFDSLAGTDTEEKFDGRFSYEIDAKKLRIMDHINDTATEIGMTKESAEETKDSGGIGARLKFLGTFLKGVTNITKVIVDGDGTYTMDYLSTETEILLEVRRFNKTSMKNELVFETKFESIKTKYETDDEISYDSFSHHISPVINNGKIYTGVLDKDDENVEITEFDLATKKEQKFSIEFKSEPSKITSVIVYDRKLILLSDEVAVYDLPTGKELYNETRIDRHHYTYAKPFESRKIQKSELISGLKPDGEVEDNAVSIVSYIGGGLFYRRKFESDVSEILNLNGKVLKTFKLASKFAFTPISHRFGDYVLLRNNGVLNIKTGEIKPIKGCETELVDNFEDAEVMDAGVFKTLENFNTLFNKYSGMVCGDKSLRLIDIEKATTLARVNLYASTALPLKVVVDKNTNKKILFQDKNLVFEIIEKTTK